MKATQSAGWDFTVSALANTQAPPNVPKRAVAKVMSIEEKVRPWPSLTSWPWRLEC